MALRTIGQPTLPAWPKIPNPGEKSGLAAMVAKPVASINDWLEVTVGENSHSQ